jgi:predicted nucleotidyltransferase
MVAVHDVSPFLADFTAWASAQADILAAALVGSHARGTATSDSDVDLVLVVEDPKKYLDHPGWVERFGRVADQRIEEYGLVTSLRVWYVHGLEAEFGLTTALWTEPPVDAGTLRTIREGMRILFERGNCLSRAAEANPRS